MPSKEKKKKKKKWHWNRFFSKFLGFALLISFYLCSIRRPIFIFVLLLPERKASKLRDG
jgi:hypothetical protein